MHTSRETSPTQETAEARFVKAFERLKNNVPEVLPIGTPVSQNNVAKEAGCVPSALRKTRFPSLVLAIQAWIGQHGETQNLSQRQKLLAQRNKNRDAKAKIGDFKRQRDCVQGKLNDANLYIVELTEKIRHLEAELEQLRPTAKVHRDLFGGAPVRK